jgi:hypothetical protein
MDNKVLEGTAYIACSRATVLLISQTHLSSDPDRQLLQPTYQDRCYEARCGYLSMVA